MSQSTVERLQDKIDGLTMAIELEQVIIDYLEPIVAAWKNNKTRAYSHYVRQSDTSKNTIKNWQQELEDYKQLLLIAEMTNEPLSQTLPTVP